jgi:two-component system, NarL family, sensor histidine kinase DegS
VANPPKKMSSPNPVLSPLQQLEEDVRSELEQAQKELKEIDLLIQQTSTEVERLAQRNAQATGHFKQLEVALDTVPRADLQAAYSTAMDAQKRLFMMRGQLEKLQSDQQHIGRYVSHLRRIVDLVQKSPDKAGPASSSPESEVGSQPSIVRIIEAQEQERQRLVRQLHDGPAQSLTNLILQAEICERVFDTDAKRARAELGELKTAVTATFQKVRDYMFDLRPMMLDDLGLVPTLRRYVDNFNEKSSVPAVFTVTGSERRFTPYKEVVIFRVIQELLANVRTHAHATRVQVMLDIGDEIAQVVVEDNGSGFNVAEVLNVPQPKGIGLSTQRERLAMLGGDFRVESAVGRGTKITLQLPVAA